MTQQGKKTETINHDYADNNVLLLSGISQETKKGANIKLTRKIGTNKMYNGE